MSRVLLRQGMLGDGDVRCVDVPAAMTLRAIVAACRDQLPQTVPLEVAVDGRRVETEAELDQPIGEREAMILAATTGQAVLGAILYAVVVAAVSYGINWAIAQLSPPAKPLGIGLDRGDDQSATYAWDGAKTSYGPGLPIPFLYGMHLLPGQVVWSDVQATVSDLGVPTSTASDILRVVLSLCEGPVHSVDQWTTTQDSQTLSGGVYIDGQPVDATADVRAWVRLGSLSQPILPAPFSGTRTTYYVGRQFVIPPALSQYAELIEVVNVEASISQVTATLTWPGGLYRILGDGSRVGVNIAVEIMARPVGATGWSLGRIYSLQSVRRDGAFSLTFETILNTSAAVTGPMEVRLLYRPTNNASTYVQLVGDAFWRDVTVSTTQATRYPGEALIALEIPAGARFSGGLPNVRTLVRGALVRMWHPTHGWSPRTWGTLPAPWDFIVHNPGRNPAWCLLDFLLARWGLGSDVTENDIDLLAFLRWAIWCDRDPSPSSGAWGEPQFRIDLVGDQPRPAWEWVLMFCQAGRAAPVVREGKISIVYQYSDAHSAGGISVPAKEPVQLITEGACEQVQVSWLPKAQRPTVLQLQIVDEAGEYLQTPVTVEDDESALNDPTDPNRDEWRAETAQLFGVTRQSQAWREGRWRHRVHRLVHRELSFVCGPWALAAEIGDVVEFQHELLRPFGSDISTAMTIRVGGTSVTTVTVDHAVSGTGLQIIIRDPDGKPQRRTISSLLAPVVGPNGRSTTQLTLASAVTCNAGAQCVVGLAEKLVEPYVITAITLQKDLRREVRAVQWVPAVHAAIPVTDYPGSSSTDSIEDSPVDPGPLPSAPPPESQTLSLLRELDGSYVVRWEVPGTMVGVEAKVWFRPGASGEWRLLGVSSDGSIRGDQLQPMQTYQFSVCWPNLQGRHVAPDAGSLLTATAEEFPPYQPAGLSNVRLDVLDAEILIQWDDLVAHDLEYYEVRAGSCWTSAAVLSRSRAPRVVFGSLPANVPLLLAARSRSGLYGPITQLASPTWTPPDSGLVVDLDEIASTPAGTHSSTQWNATDDVIELAGENLTGTYTSGEQDAGYQAPIFWRVSLDWSELEDATIAEWNWRIGSGEARWWTLNGRPASVWSPGVDWQLRIDDLAMPIQDLPPDLLVNGHVGEAGSHTRVLVESRFFKDGAWGSYAPHVDRTVVASRMQVRLTFGRRSTRYRARVTALRYTGHL